MLTQCAEKPRKPRTTPVDFNKKRRRLERRRKQGVIPQEGALPQLRPRQHKHRPTRLLRKPVRMPQTEMRKQRESMRRGLRRTLRLREQKEMLRRLLREMRNV